MHRVPLLAAGVALATAAVVLGSAHVHSGAEPATPAVTRQGFLGAWRLVFDTPTGASQSLLTVMSDGTVIFSGRPVSPATGGFPVIFSSTAHGAWEQIGDTSARFTWVGLVTDGEGTLLAVVTDSVEATLSADSQSWSGAYSATVDDPTGTQLYVGGSTVQATRIGVQPVATPAASTPVTG